MNFTVSIHTDNAAFVDDEYEVERLLRVAIHGMREGESFGMLFDVNGNRVGSWGFVDDE